MLISNTNLYNDLKKIGSNSPTPDINIWGQNMTEKANFKL